MTIHYRKRSGIHNDYVTLGVVNPDDLGHGGPAAEVTYREGAYVPNFNRTWNGDYDVSDAYHQHVYDNNLEEDEPEQLFHERPPHVDSLFADASMRPHVATLLGGVLSHAQIMGMPVEASSSLSEHSSRLVQQGMAAGLVVGAPDNPFGDVTNSIGDIPAHRYAFTRTLYDLGDRGAIQIPDEEVASMRKTGREAVLKARGKTKKKQTPRTPKRPPQGEQLNFGI